MKIKIHIRKDGKSPHRTTSHNYITLSSLERNGETVWAWFASDDEIAKHLCPKCEAALGNELRTAIAAAAAARNQAWGRLPELVRAAISTASGGNRTVIRCCAWILFSPLECRAPHCERVRHLHAGNRAHAVSRWRKSHLRPSYTPTVGGGRCVSLLTRKSQDLNCACLLLYSRFCHRAGVLITASKMKATLLYLHGRYWIGTHVDQSQSAWLGMSKDFLVSSAAMRWPNGQRGTLLRTRTDSALFVV